MFSRIPIILAFSKKSLPFQKVLKNFTFTRILFLAPKMPAPHLSVQGCRLPKKPRRVCRDSGKSKSFSVGACT
jgi:hypothetical protein